MERTRGKHATESAQQRAVGGLALSTTLAMPFLYDGEAKKLMAAVYSAIGRSTRPVVNEAE